MENKRKAEQMALVAQPKKPRYEMVAQNSSKGTVVQSVSYIKNICLF